MIKAMAPLRRLFRFCAAALLLWSVSAAAAAPAGASWQAVLVAGDNAQPVFDNAVTRLARWLAYWGVPASDIHRLSAGRQRRDAAAEPATLQRVLQRIAALRPRPGQACLVFITSHGKEDAGVWLAAGRRFLTPGALAQALAAGCGAAPTVVIVSACYSGAFDAAPMQAPNRVILTAARGDRPSFGCQADRTYTVYDECLLSVLPGAATWRAVYDGSAACVREREAWLHVYPSEPQAFFGARVADLPVR